MIFRSSLIKVDGFNSPQEFEKFVSEANLKANSILKEKDPDRFYLKYGSEVKEANLGKQT